MHSLGQRLMNVLGAMTSSLLIYSAMLIATTLVMNFVNFPMPTFHGISWSMSGAREAEQQILVGIPFGNNASWINMVESRDRSGRFAYYNAGGQLDSNVYYISPDETDFPFRAKEIARVFGLVPAVRSVYQARILVSGVFDFSKCWNWNTKAIYVSIVASYITPKSVLNEVTVCDSVIRIAYPPSGLQAAVNEAQRAYRTSSNSSISLKESDWKVYLSTENQQVLQDFEKDIANEHDTAGKTDHINKRVYYNQSIKYALTDFYNKPVSPKNITLTVRYQVMSTTGWSPLQVSRFSAEGSF